MLPPPMEPQLEYLVKAARDNEVSWGIVADWLEENGHSYPAKYLRQNCPNVGMSHYHCCWFGYRKPDPEPDRQGSWSLGMELGTTPWIGLDGSNIEVTDAVGSPALYKGNPEHFVGCLLRPGSLRRQMFEVSTPREPCRWMPEELRQPFVGPLPAHAYVMDL